MPAGELNIEQADALIAYLRQAGHLDPGEQPVIRPIRGGVSNRTVRVERSSGAAWVLKQALARLRVEVEWRADPARIEREATGMGWLARLAPPESVPELVFLDEANHLLAMTAVPEPHANFKQLLLAGEVLDDHIRAFGRLLGHIHRQAWEQRETLAAVFADRSFFESLRLEPYYGYTGQQVPAGAAFLADLSTATRRRHLTLVHGDFSPKNILVHEGRLILLDHEVIHFGDPAFDLGFALTHLLSKGHHLPDQRERFGRAALSFWVSYRDELGDVPWTDELERNAVHHTLACLLARVAGRSPLEYLNRQERARQQEVVTGLMHDVPSTVDGLTARFLEQVGDRSPTRKD